jgi:hypothetical protein
MYHLHVRRLSRGTTASAMRAFDYICRTGQFATRGDCVRLVQGVHLPSWTSNSSAAFWLGLDAFPKRDNARLLFTIVVAIPRALSKEQQNALVHKFALLIARTSSGRRRRIGVPVSYAIHEGVRSDDATTGRLPNTHVHFLVSTSIEDGVQRPARSWFMRANSATPSAGGAPRSSVIGGRRWLLRIRRAWAKLANAALRAAGLPERIDHRSHAARGMDQLPTRHLGPYGAANARAGKPSPVVAHNERIRAFNRELEAWHARFRRDLELQRQVEGQEWAFVLSLEDRDAVEVRSLLRQHPLAGDSDALLAAPLLVGPAVRPTRPAQTIEERQAELVKRLRAGLDRGCSLVRDRDRLWILRRSGDFLAVAVGDYVACDTAPPGAGAWLGRVAMALGISSARARCLPEAAPAAAELAAWLIANGGSCEVEASTAKQNLTLRTVTVASGSRKPK